jgi:hypothetical protein
MTLLPILGPPYQLRLAGAGAALRGPRGLALTLGPTTAQAYSNAQIDDYRGLGAQRFLHQPPLTLSLRARFSHPSGALLGTAGFGFWNYPLVLGARDWPRLPTAIWFFYGSPPGNMALAQGVPGHGFKAAVIETTRPQALALIPFAPLAVPLLNLPPVERRLWPLIQRAVGVRETPIAAQMSEWHSYALRWGQRSADFFVDGQPVLLNAPAPAGPLCLVIWLDNQYLIVTPQGRLGWGLLPSAERQWIEIEQVRLSAGMV